MSSLVAIGGPGLFGVVDAYRAQVPSDVWVLGLKTPRDPVDPTLRSLEALIEPFMEAYFSAELQERLEALAAQLGPRPATVGGCEPHAVGEAAAAVMWRGYAASVGLVVMLDRAHATDPVELVLTDDANLMARTAGAWARARGVRAMTVPERFPLRRPAIPSAERAVVVGPRAAQAYRALDSRAFGLTALASPEARAAVVPDADRANRRTAARSALGRALNWSESDLVVVFEPAGVLRESVLEPRDAFDRSLGAMFAAFAAAGRRVASLRLAVLGAPATADGLARTNAAAASAGLAPGAYAYTQTDHAVWLAGADICVSVDSTRSLDATLLGVPAVNLWRPESWYEGPAFAAEDGVLDTALPNLAGTLVALAENPALRAQIASIAADALAAQAQTSVPAVAAIAAELAAGRRSAWPAVRKPVAKPDIVIWAPDYNHASGGIRALYRLCHLINLAGGMASMYPSTKLHPAWNTPARDMLLTDQTIVIIPEIVVAHPSLQRVVRWVLNVPGLLGGPKTYDEREMVFYYSDYFRAGAQAATAEVLTDERELMVHTIEPELFYNDRSRARLYDCVYIGKGEAIYARVQPREIRDALIIKRAATVWPANRAETAAVLRGCRRLYSFDGVTALVHEGIICGAEVFFVREDGTIERADYDLANYARNYYDLTQVERFLRLVTERWPA